MAVIPRVSIVLPLYNDEEYVAAALDSCLAQSLAEIEILAIDDASTDSTTEIVEAYARRDPRIRLVRQPANRSAFQARRVGVAAATAPYVLFLDGDDELAPNAAQAALGKALSARADVVGFGVEIVASSSGVPTRLQAALQPKFDEIAAPHIIPQLFPAGEPANGHIWRYLFATSVLRGAYEGIDEHLAYYRANDLPITFLALALAKKYASVAEQLYRYYFRRGTSGHAIDNIEHFRFLLGGIEPITAFAPQVRAIAARAIAPTLLLESYESARLQVIGSVLRYCLRDTSGELQRTCITLLKAEVGDLDTIRAAASTCSEALTALSMHASDPVQPKSPVRSVLLTTRRLDTGGLQAVLLKQAATLVDAGFKVTLAVFQDAARDVEVPPGVTLVQVANGDVAAQLDCWLSICRKHGVDVIVDHYVLYNETWPWLALGALAIGVPTIGWVHSFALRPLIDQSQRISFISAHARILLHIVTLSPTDAAFWKLQGIERAVYLPNPLSDLAIKALRTGSAKQPPSGPLQLAWWGRLDRSTKQVHHLIEVAEQLRSRGIDFRLTIVGPDSGELTAQEMRQSAAARGVDDVIEFIGEQDADSLLMTLRGAHLLVSTSAIEGFQLTIVEAQALGMPVVMYDLPWLTTVRGNAGLVTTSPGDPAALADAVISIARNPEQYTQMSSAARAFAGALAEVDVSELTIELLTGDLADTFSTTPTLDDARILVEWLVRIAERNVHDGRGDHSTRAEISELRRERDRAQSRLRHVMEGSSFKIGRALTFLPRRVQQFTRARKRPNAAQSTRTPHVVTAPPPPLRAPADSPLRPPSDSPDVTFVIPVYNSAPWLEDCISSVLAQSEVDIEVICINDGSTDESLEILQRFAARDPRVSVIDQTNSGQSVGRNRGLDLAVGRYIIYLDSDDYWPTDALSTLVGRADADGLDVLLFDCAAFLDGDVDEKTWRWYSTYYQRAQAYRQTRSGIGLMGAMRRNKEYRPHVGLYLTRTSYVRQLGLRFIPGIVHQDNPYTFRLLLNAAKAAHEHVDAYARRIRPGSTITTLTSERSARGYLLSYIEMTRELEGRELPRGDAEAVTNIVDSVYEGARKQFALISDAATRELRTLADASDAQAVFDSLVNANR